MFPKPNAPHSGIFFLNKIKKLKELGVEVIVLCPIPYAPGFLSSWKESWANLKRIPQITTNYGFPVYYPRYLRPPGRWFRFFEGLSMYLGIKKKIATIQRRFEFDVVIGGMITNDAYVAYKIADKYRVPSIGYAVGDDINIYPFQKKTLHNLTLKILNRLTQVITVGDGLKDNLYKVFPTMPKIVKTNFLGIDMDKFNRTKDGFLLEKYKLGQDSVIGLFVGSITKEKGIIELMNAIKQVDNSHFKMLIVGNGDLKDWCNKFISKNNLTDRCYIVGDVPFNELPNYYTNSDFFISPTHNEGLANVLVEAATSGLPIIASDINEVKDVLVNNKNGFTFPVEDHKELADKIIELVNNNNLRDEFSKSSENLAKSKFDMTKNAKEFIEIIENLSS